MNVHEQIKAKLDAGCIVYSFALGRIGEITSVDDNAVAPVNIKGKRQNGCTTFLTGDPVHLEQRQDIEHKEIWIVVND